MSFPFDANTGLVVVDAELVGPSGQILLRLALDTGATFTMINVGPLAIVGYDPSLGADRVQVTTASGVEFIPRIEISRFDALGQTRTGFSVLSHTLPPSSGIDGLLGLDFLRAQRLTIDFRAGSVDLD